MGYHPHLWTTDMDMLYLRLQTYFPATDGKENRKSLQ